MFVFSSIDFPIILSVDIPFPTIFQGASSKDNGDAEEEEDEDEDGEEDEE